MSGLKPSDKNLYLAISESLGRLSDGVPVNFVPDVYGLHKVQKVTRRAPVSNNDIIFSRLKNTEKKQYLAAGNIIKLTLASHPITDLDLVLQEYDSLSNADQHNQFFSSSSPWLSFWSSSKKSSSSKGYLPVVDDSCRRKVIAKRTLSIYGTPSQVGLEGPRQHIIKSQPSTTGAASRLGPYREVECAPDSRATFSKAPPQPRSSTSGRSGELEVTSQQVAQESSSPALPPPPPPLASPPSQWSGRVESSNSQGDRVFQPRNAEAKFEPEGSGGGIRIPSVSQNPTGKDRDIPIELNLLPSPAPVPMPPPAPVRLPPPVPVRLPPTAPVPLPPPVPVRRPPPMKPAPVVVKYLPRKESSQVPIANDPKQSAQLLIANYADTPPIILFDIMKVLIVKAPNSEKMEYRITPAQLKLLARYFRIGIFTRELDLHMTHLLAMHFGPKAAEAVDGAAKKTESASNQGPSPQSESALLGGIFDPELLFARQHTVPASSVPGAGHGVPLAKGAVVKSLGNLFARPDRVIIVDYIKDHIAPSDLDTLFLMPRVSSSPNGNPMLSKSKDAGRFSDAAVVFLLNAMVHKKAPKFPFPVPYSFGKGGDVVLSEIVEKLNARLKKQFVIDFPLGGREVESGGW